MNSKNSIVSLSQKISSLYIKNQTSVFTILVGGCSRSGKSTLTKQLIDILTTGRYPVVSLNLDSWLNSVDKRKVDSKVTERYDIIAISDSVEKLLNGKTILPPVYDPITRKRLECNLGHPVKIKSGILIVEGVIALSINNLVKKSNFNIFIEIPDCVRIKRLIDFYGRVKKLPQPEYKSIIIAREKEEIPFVKKTAVNADIIFRW